MARQMKDSGVEWIGEIPEDTKLIQLRFIADITTGNMDTQNRENDGEYPFYVRSPKVERSNQYSFDDVEAILMAGDGVGAGRVFHYVQGKYACHQRVYRMNNFRYVQSSFLKYYLEGLFPMIMDQGSAKSTVDSVRLPMLQGFKVVVFNEAEQQKIIDFLDEKVGEIDSVIAKTKETIEDYKKYKQAIITDAVTKGIYDTVTLKATENVHIDKIPAHWETCVLLSRKKSSGKSTRIEIEIDLSEADRRECIGTATYQEIKDYVWEHYQTKVSHLYIAQIKKKCGLDVGENFNKTKTEGNKVPNCPEEKERMIREALEYFGMINKE